MKIVLFYHSLISDWNHGNAHFLRGVASELLALGHHVTVYEPENAWSVENLLQDYGPEALAQFHAFYPHLHSVRYRDLDLNEALDGADLVIVHEWSSHDLVREVGTHRAQNRNYRLLFHDTHHRAVTEPGSMAAYDLSNYDGVLAYGAILRDLYLEIGWAEHVWTWHEAADARLFRPYPEIERTGDVVWVGNWGDDERTAELHEYLLDPVRDLGLDAEVYGVRYPESGKAALLEAGIRYRGWLANFKVPEVFARFKVTIHVPRRPYVERLRGIPTIRPFEALACGIPLISAPWHDAENLFTPGEDYLTATDGQQMREQLRTLLSDPALAEHLATNGRKTILKRHTCAHRVQELLDIYRELTTA